MGGGAEGGGGVLVKSKRGRLLLSNFLSFLIENEPLPS